jgi:hypothetical protein
MCAVALLLVGLSPPRFARPLRVKGCPPGCGPGSESGGGCGGRIPFPGEGSAPAPHGGGRVRLFQGYSLERLRPQDERRVGLGVVDPDASRRWRRCPRWVVVLRPGDWSDPVARGTLRNFRSGGAGEQCLEGVPRGGVLLGGTSPFRVVRGFCPPLLPGWRARRRSQGGRPGETDHPPRPEPTLVWP